jgi:streptogramin lyase
MNSNIHQRSFVVVFLLGVTLTQLAAAANITTVAGTGSTAANGDAGEALEINLSQPFGVEIGPGGALYITEVGNHRVWRLEPQTNRLTVVAGNGRKGYSGDGGPATKAELNEPYEVRFDAAGHMYFVEMQNHLVRRVDAPSGVISTVAGTGQAGFGGDGGPAIKAQFRQPHSIALDGRGGLYIADIGNHRIRRVDLNTGLVDTVAGTGERKLPQEGGEVRGTPVLGPRALFIDGRTMWVALREGHSVWHFSLDEGKWHHTAGTGERGFSGDGGAARAAKFDGPKGVAVGPDRHVYVADTENQAIRRIDIVAGRITTVAGAGPQANGFGGDGGPATQGKMARPHGICVAPDGRLYIGDTLNHRVRRVEPTP